MRSRSGSTRAAIAAIGALLLAGSAGAQARPDASLRVTVADPSGAVIVGARVSVAPEPREGAAPAPASLETSNRGEALFRGLEPGRYTVRAEAPGFEPTEVHDVRVRAGENHRDVKLAIAKLAETVDVGRDPRERASDPRSDAFATVLSQAQIDELPDDPDEMEQMLKDMAGPGATLRVNGFRGGKLPRKDQIQSIRFRRNMFAADAHEAGVVTVDIVTRPGLDAWRGSTNVGFRGRALSARNAFAPEKGDEERGRYGLSLNGPLKKKRASVSFTADGIDAFDSQTIVAALPSGFFADSVKRPNDTLNLTGRVELGVGASQLLRAEFQRNHTFTDNLGVGDFDLPERAYRQTQNEQVVRVGLAGPPRKALYNELRLQFRRGETVWLPASAAPAVLVLNAFDSGGAQRSGSTGADEIELADDLDIAVGRHAIRTGALLEGGRYLTDELRNAGGTFTFASLDAFRAGRPTTFSRNAGDPRVSATEWQAGVYVQDDFRARKDLTVSGGIRQEYQTPIGGLHLAPRGGITWSPFKNGRTTVRAGGGVFYDWFDASSYEQAVQLDGTHQRIETTLQPGYPDPALGGLATMLPPGRVRLAALDQPELREAMAGVEQTLPRNLRVNAMYIRRRGLHLLRGVDVNAPIPGGTRPDPASGTVTEIQPTAESAYDAFSVGINFARPEKRIFVSANYQLARSTNDTDSPFALPADSRNLEAERGPAATDARHRFFSLANVPLAWHFRLGTAVRVQSALPYTITTGRDDNGDSVSNDRPAGVGRNSARGRAQIDVGARLSWAIGLGSQPPAGVGGPQIRIIRGGDADPLGSLGGPEGLNRRYTLELYVQTYNLLNHTNALTYTGVLTSPFYGQATAAAPPRRAEVGVRLTF